MIVITHGKSKGKTTVQQFVICDNPTPGSFGDYILMKNDLAEQDENAAPGKRIKQLKFNTKFLEKILKKFGELHCEYCGRPGLVLYYWFVKIKPQNDVATTAHFIPLSAAPHLALEESNCLVACEACNKKKKNHIWPKESIKYPYNRNS